MPLVWDLITDNNSMEGKLVTTVVIVAIAIVVGTVVGRVWSRRIDDRYRKYYARKIVHYVVVAVTLIGLGILWRPFAGQLGLVLGLMAAGIAIGLQDLIGSLAGWFNIQSGSIFRVGDRVDVGGVQGDVIDISPVRTKIMEIGSGLDDDMWVRGRQYTGRIVSIANKATFAEPVFNYSASFEFIWEEVMIPIDYRDDWHGAERIMTEEAQRISSSAEAEDAIARMIQRYPLAHRGRIPCVRQGHRRLSRARRPIRGAGPQSPFCQGRTDATGSRPAQHGRDPDCLDHPEPHAQAGHP